MIKNACIKTKAVTTIMAHVIWLDGSTHVCVCIYIEPMK